MKSKLVRCAWPGIVLEIISMTACVDPAFQLEGIVIDSSGRPVENASVGLLYVNSDHVEYPSQNQQRCRSGKDGRFSCVAMGWRSDNYRIAISREGSTRPALWPM